MKSIFILLISAISVTVFAQNKTLNGKIIDANSRFPMSGAMIQIKDSKQLYSTTKTGAFEITFDYEGVYILEFSFIGYNSQTLTLNTKDLPKRIEIELVEQIMTLPEVELESSSIIGGADKIGKIPGSATYLSPKELSKFAYADPMRSLKMVAGVNIQDEEGFGLRPNIGMRGTGVERSSKITIMEDGILMAPAPYAAPAAYYFPEFGRMQSVEILKGSSQIKYGPYTNGGVINFISNPVPQKLGANARFEYGSKNSKLLNVIAGYGGDNIGFSVEAFNRSSDGFKVLDNNGNTGFKKSNWIGKAYGKFRTGTVNHRVSVKFGQTNEKSNETYLGLTDHDFEVSPNRRYAASQVDNMKADHTLSSISYTAQFPKNISVNVTAYHNTFKRNWYKLDKVTDDNGNKTSISKILADPIKYSNAYNILTGSSSATDDALHVKANNRSYVSQGVQGQLGWYKKIGKLDHKIEVGLRYHQDQMDRFQWIDDYKMNNGTMMLNTVGMPGTESNRIEAASALASFVQYKLKYERFTIIPGIRYENITVYRDDYGKNDPDRTGANLTSRDNNIDVWIPGIGVHYALNEYLNAFAGVHKGFSPPGSKDGTNPEESVNFETGVKFHNNRAKFEVIGYYNNYKNLLGVDFNAGGGGGSNDLFNAGKARVYGLEASGYYDLLPNTSKFSLPLGLVYTYTYGQFLNSFTSTYEPWEDVTNGDLMPYLAPHQLGLNLSLEHSKFAVNLAAKYITEMRTVAGTGDFSFEQSIPSNFIVDFSAQYVLNSHIMFYGGIQNLGNKAYIVSRRPAGVRPGLPRWYSGGVRFFL